MTPIGRLAGAAVIGVTLSLCLAAPGRVGADEAIATAAGPEALATEAVTLPEFQPGMWQYRRTVITGPGGKPQITVVKKCTSPSTEIEQKMAQLRQKNCLFTPLRHEKGRYSSSWVCPTPSGPMRFRDVLSATDATAYEDSSEARLGAQVSQQRIEATRLGDCKMFGPVHH